MYQHDNNIINFCMCNDFPNSLFIGEFTRNNCNIYLKIMKKLSCNEIKNIYITKYFEKHT